MQNVITLDFDNRDINMDHARGVENIFLIKQLKWSTKRHGIKILNTTFTSSEIFNVIVSSPSFNYEFSKIKSAQPSLASKIKCYILNLRVGILYRHSFALKFLFVAAYSVFN